MSSKWKISKTIGTGTYSWEPDEMICELLDSIEAKANKSGRDDFHALVTEGLQGIIERFFLILGSNLAFGEYTAQSMIALDTLLISYAGNQVELLNELRKDFEDD